MGALEAEPLVQPHGGLHEIGGVQYQRGRGGGSRPVNALVHEGGADATPPRRWRDSEQAHLRPREGQGGAARPLDHGARGVEQDGADHAVILERDDLGGARALRPRGSR